MAQANAEETVRESVYNYLIISRDGSIVKFRRLENGATVVMSDRNPERGQKVVPDSLTCSLSKMPRFNFFLAAGLLAGLLLSASLIQAKDFTVGLSWNAKESELVQKWEDYLILEGKSQGEPAGINFKWVINVANGDPARQAANIEDLINQGVNLIIARAEDSAAIGASIRAANSAGIPFITFDRASSSDKPTAHVGGDSYDQAKTTAEAFVALLKANNVQGKCIELQGALTDINAVNRSKGWHDVTDKSGVVVTVVSVPPSGTRNCFAPERQTRFVRTRKLIACLLRAISVSRRCNPL